MDPRVGRLTAPPGIWDDTDLSGLGEDDVRYDLDLDSGVLFSTAGMIDVVQRAEARGFDAVWKGESNSADPIVSLSALAVHTKTIKLGTAVYHVFGRSPVTLGIQAATLQDLCGGRLILGLGVSNKTIASWHSMTFDRPLRRLREYAEVTRAVARGERVEYDGEIYPTPPFKLSWRPSYPELPIIFAGLGEQMTRLAGRYADGIMVNMANPPLLRDIVSRVRAAAAEAGRDPNGLDYVAKVRICIHPDREVAKAKLKGVLAFYNLAEFYRDMIGQMGFEKESESIRETYRSGGFRAAQGAVPDLLVEQLPTIAATSIEEARERIQPYLDAGITRLIIPYLPATDDTAADMKAFLDSWPVV